MGQAGNRAVTGISCSLPTLRCSDGVNRPTMRVSVLSLSLMERVRHTDRSVGGTKPTAMRGALM